MNSDLRKSYFSLISASIKRNDSGKELEYLLKLLNNKCSNRYIPEPYGIADEVYFGDLTDLVRRLFAYDNKHYYIYKAIDNPNKIGYLSRRWYYILSLNEKLWIKQGATSLRRSKLRVEFLRSHGTMASPTKLLKLAFAENPNAKFLALHFPLGKDKKTVHGDLLERFGNAIMRNCTTMHIEPASIQSCYDLDLYDRDYSGSGHRFATQSCMYRKKVAAFYEAFGVEGRIVYNREGNAVARFLLWPLPNGKKYVDRVYTKSSFANEVLETIDKLYPDSEYEKYPSLRADYCETAYKVIVPLKDKDKLLNIGHDGTGIPYVDTFPHLVHRGASLFLSNMGEGQSSSLRIVGNYRRFTECPYCHMVSYSGDPYTRQTIHELYCTGYTPRIIKHREMLKIFREAANNVSEEERNGQTLSTVLGL